MIDNNRLRNILVFYVCPFDVELASYAYYAMVGPAHRKNTTVQRVLRWLRREGAGGTAQGG